MRPLEEKEDNVNYLDPRNFIHSREERKIASVVALATSGAFLVFIGGLIGLVAWAVRPSLTPWAMEFTSHPAGIFIIILCGMLWVYVPELIIVYLGTALNKALGLIAIGFFMLGLAIMILGFLKLLELEAWLVMLATAILTSCLSAAPAFYHVGKQPPPPRTHQSHH
jgi:hypothetical protein